MRAHQAYHAYTTPYRERLERHCYKHLAPKFRLYKPNTLDSGCVS